MSIFRIDIAGSHLHRLTHGHKDLNPTWSPDGRHIAFVRRHSVTGWDVFVMRASGRNVVDISNDAGRDSFPAWSPDGTQIAYTCQPGRHADICVMNADGSGQTDLTNYHSDHFYPAWSPAGRRIAFESNQGGREGIYVMRADGSQVRTVVVRRGFEARAPSWASNDRIVFTENRTGHPNFEVYSVRASGSGLRRLTHDRLTELTPSVSPSGSRIATITGNNVTLATKIAVMRSDGLHLHAITPDWGKRRLQEAGW